MTLEDERVKILNENKTYAATLMKDDNLNEIREETDDIIDDNFNDL